MVVAANSRAQTNHRTLVLCGASVVRPVARKLAVLLDMNKTPAVAWGMAACNADLESRWCRRQHVRAQVSGCGARGHALGAPSAWYSSRGEKTIRRECRGWGPARAERKSPGRRVDPSASGVLNPGAIPNWECREPIRRESVVPGVAARSEEHTSELQSLRHLVCR